MVLALPAATADAASVATWDKVAQCESTGDWNYYKSGHPYFGGLQISLPTWRAYGGEQYASYPHQATKKQQILTAEKILAGQGPGAWPNCGRSNGLGSDHADPYPAPSHKASNAGVYRPAESKFYVADRTGGVYGWSGFGVPGDKPLTGDWNGDGQDTFGVYRPGDQTFHLSNDNATAAVSVTYGSPGDIPLVGDWDGDGKASIGVYHPADQTFYLSNDNRVAAYAIQMGVGGDTPMTGDWNGDGKDTIGVYRGSDQTFYLTDSQNSAPVNHQVRFGNPGDIPIKGDWNGDGTDKVGVYQIAGSDFVGAGKDSDQAIYNVRFGVPGDVPITGQW
ncbi:transglycosylase family protein [Streptomyces virginiae]|uniref:Transglycosylase family protein n=1 Tax=Streptomyces virginiae TaxID=1961 RepID=A0ABZ1TJZ4_STRVG|nr:transglycosylase family protein [Streptomyces virginiae]WTB24819.1 transglycosylase family protein [Streptomyces virginiae]